MYRGLRRLDVCNLKKHKKNRLFLFQKMFLSLFGCFVCACVCVHAHTFFSFFFSLLSQGNQKLSLCIINELLSVVGQICMCMDITVFCFHDQMKSFLQQ